MGQMGQNFPCAPYCYVSFNALPFSCLPFQVLAVLLLLLLLHHFLLFFLRHQHLSRQTLPTSSTTVCSSSSSSWTPSSPKRRHPFTSGGGRHHAKHHFLPPLTTVFFLTSLQSPYLHHLHLPPLFTFFRFTSYSYQHILGRRPYQLLPFFHLHRHGRRCYHSTLSVVLIIAPLLRLHRALLQHLPIQDRPPVRFTRHACVHPPATLRTSVDDIIDSVVIGDPQDFSLTVSWHNNNNGSISSTIFHATSSSWMKQGSVSIVTLERGEVNDGNLPPCAGRLVSTTAGHRRTGSGYCIERLVRQQKSAVAVRFFLCSQLTLPHTSK